jgi:RepB DNA-primase from phage plasmid
MEKDFLSLGKRVLQMLSVQALEQRRQFEIYARAVGAQRYRVTSIFLPLVGEKKVLILDKTESGTIGFEAADLLLRIKEMVRLQDRGENIYYTPLSNDKHHILVDDMSRSKLEKFVGDGFKAAVLIESSPGNYQVVITLQKLGTKFDREVGNRLSRFFNKEYGDSKLVGGVHAHRAPGFENRKPKHRREDGSYPVVRILKAERRQCEKTLIISRNLDMELERKSNKNEEVESSSSVITSSTSAYIKHFKDLQSRFLEKEIDFSRIDSMIAVRLRVTGHSQQSIEEAICVCAPLMRPSKDARNWQDYAQRTARYPFSNYGEIQVRALDKYRASWKFIEEREFIENENVLTKSSVLIGSNLEL